MINLFNKLNEFNQFHKPSLLQGGLRTVDVGDEQLYTPVRKELPHLTCFDHVCLEFVSDNLLVVLARFFTI